MYVLIYIFKYTAHFFERQFKNIEFLSLDYCSRNTNNIDHPGNHDTTGEKASYRK